MSMYRSLFIRCLFVFPVLLCALALPQRATAQTEEEMEMLQLYFREDELVVTATRSPKPISQASETITVVTAKEIEMMNAHTLTDVLNTVPGVQIEIRGGPGSPADAHIQGSESRHILVMIDGVPQNNLSDNRADISSIPIQNIERIEIIKGPVSSSWGSSLGGIINVITKGPNQSRGIGGTLSASYGERNTGDFRAELSGTKGPLGYYLFAGNLTTNGFNPNSDYYANNIYGKIRLDITDRLSSTVTFGYSQGNRGLGEFPEIGISSRNDFEYLFSSLLLNYAFNDDADVTLSLWMSRKHIDFLDNPVDKTEIPASRLFGDSQHGGDLRFNWRRGMHTVVVGAEFNDGELKSSNITSGRQELDTWAVFANDTIVVDRFSFTPGIRYDDTSTNGDFLSPSLGITYKIDDKNLLRGYIGRGFSIPPLSATFGVDNFFRPADNLKVEKVMSYKLGVESIALKYLWLRSTLFLHDVSDAIALENGTDTDTGAPVVKTVNKDKVRRQGVEIELKTIPVYHTSLSAGFTYLDATDRETGERLKDTAPYTYDIGIQYDHNNLKALLTGHFIWWNAIAERKGKYNAFVWDFNVSKRFALSAERSLDLFFSIHNIFDSSQYLDVLFKNPGRWIEGGVRFSF